MITTPPNPKPDSSRVAAMKIKQAPFIERMRQAMRAKGRMRQSALAAATGIRQPIISKHLSGICEPMPDAMKKYAEVLGVNPSWLWLGTGLMRGTEPDATANPIPQQATTPVATTASTTAATAATATAATAATVITTPLPSDVASIIQSMSMASAAHLRMMVKICKVIPLVAEHDLPDFTRAIIDAAVQDDMALVLVSKKPSATPAAESMTEDELQLQDSYESAIDNMRLAAHVIAGCHLTKEANQFKSLLMHYRNIDLNGKARLLSILSIGENIAKQQKYPQAA